MNWLIVVLARIGCRRRKYHFPYSIADQDMNKRIHPFHILFCRMERIIYAHCGWSENVRPRDSVRPGKTLGGQTDDNTDTDFPPAVRRPGNGRRHRCRHRHPGHRAGSDGHHLCRTQPLGNHLAALLGRGGRRLFRRGRVRTHAGGDRRILGRVAGDDRRAGPCRRTRAPARPWGRGPAGWT